MDTVHAYIAGMIDADGTIGIRRFGNGNGRIHYRPMIEVTNMSEDVMDLLKSTFQGCKCYERNRKYNTGGIFTWKVVGKNCIPVIQAIRQFLVIKGKQADVCLACAERIGKPFDRWTDDKRLLENSIRHSFYMECKRLNSRPKKETETCAA